MKVTLKNVNSSEHYNVGSKAYEIVFVQRDSELILCTKDGKEIGTIMVEVMENDERLPEGENFYLNLKARNHGDCVRGNDSFAVGVYRCDGD